MDTQRRINRNIKLKESIMDAIKMARELGKAIQQDEKYLKYIEAKKANEADAALNELIGKLNLIQLSYQAEAEKETPDEAKMKQFDEEFRSIYGDVMINENMKKFEEARQGVDDMMNYIMQLLSLCVNGEDPDTCEPAPAEGGCTGNCSSCGGC